MSEAVGTPESSGGGGGGGAREPDRFLPIANIGRIMRRGVPENGKIAKDAKESVQECLSEFISFITSEASDKCMKEKRKTINGDDLIWSMGTLGFEDYVEPLKLYLKLYRETEGDTKGSRSSEQAGKKEIVLNGQPGPSVLPPFKDCTSPSSSSPSTVKFPASDGSSATSLLFLFSCSSLLLLNLWISQIVFNVGRE